MSESKTPKDCFHYRMTHKGFTYNKNDFWKPGDPITKQDEILLRNVKAFYRENGYSPSRADLPQEVSKLKHRFRVWKNVLIAANVPISNDPENQRKRQSAQGSIKTDYNQVWKN